MQVISKDSKVVSVLQKSRGESGWRELQGETMRALLLDLIKVEVSNVLFYIHQMSLKNSGVRTHGLMI
jgi:NADH:ubiquinone oxidoreductase subunit E